MQSNFNHIASHEATRTSPWLIGLWAVMGWIVLGLPLTISGILSFNPVPSKLKNLFGRQWHKTVCGLILSGLVFLLLQTPQAIAAAVEVDSVTSGGTYGPLEPTSSRNIVRDTNGYWYVAYAISDEIYLARSTDGSTWGKIELVGDAGIIRSASNDFTQPAIDINPDRNTIHLVWMDITDGEIYYSQCSTLANWNLASGWTTASGGTSPRYEKISNAGTETCHNPAIAVDWDGYPHVVWRETGASSNYIKYDTYDGSIWKATDVDAASSSNDIDHPSIDISISSPDDASYGNHVHLAYRQKFHAIQDRWAIDYATSSDYTNFTVTQNIIYSANDKMDPPSLAVDHNDYIYVVAYNETINDAVQNFYDTAWASSNGTAFFQPDTTLQQWNPVVGINWAHSDHRLVQVKELATRYIYKWDWNATNKAFENNTSTGNDAQASDACSNIMIEKRKPETATDMGYVWWDSTAGKVYFDTITNVATAVDLISFTAQGDGNAIKVEWETGAEFDNIGFHLYRANSPGGPYTRLTDKLISAARGRARAPTTALSIRM